MISSDSDPESWTSIVATARTGTGGQDPGTPTGDMASAGVPTAAGAARTAAAAGAARVAAADDAEEAAISTALATQASRRWRLRKQLPRLWELLRRCFAFFDESGTEPAALAAGCSALAGVAGGARAQEAGSARAGEAGGAPAGEAGGVPAEEAHMASSKDKASEKEASAVEKGAGTER